MGITFMMCGYKTFIILISLYSVWCLDNVTIDLLTPVAEFGEACGYQVSGFIFLIFFALMVTDE